MLRGLVTPEQTTLIASTHRAFAMVEKENPGDGVGDPAVVSIATEFAARRLIAFDMEAIAKAEGSVISAAMFGALAATKALPFDRAAFESAIRAGGTGVTSSLRAFAAAFNRARQIQSSRCVVSRRSVSRRCRRRRAIPSLIACWRAFGRAFPESAQPMLFAGVRRLVDYLDPDYGLEYLDCVGSCSTSIARMAGRRRASRSPPPPPNMSRSRWPTMTSRASPTSRSANPAGRVCASKLPPQRIRSSQRPSISIREPTSCAALCPSDGASGSKADRSIFKASRSRGQPRTAHPDQHRDRLSRACGGRKFQEPSARIATPRARSAAPRGLAVPRRASAGRPTTRWAWRFWRAGVWSRAIPIPMRADCRSSIA